MEETILEEWQDLGEDFKKLEAINKVYLEKLEQVNSYQKECEKHIAHQQYRMSIMRQSAKTLPVDRLESLNEEMLKREVQLQDIQQTLPKPSDTYLKVILGNVNVSILNKDDKLKYKSEYEKFKLIMSAVAFLFAVLNLYIVNRLLERIHLFVLVWYYCTLTIRESILKVNGSKIKGWWRLHHFLSTITTAILLIWPESETWNLFRNKFIIFTCYLSIVQYLQFRYQNGVLYRLKALGERHNMDITIDGFHHWMWRGLSFLFPCLFAVYIFQFYLAYSLYNLRYVTGATWHVRVLSILFSILSLGNTTTLIMVIPKKFKHNVMLKYRFLSKKLARSLSSELGKKD